MWTVVSREWRLHLFHRVKCLPVFRVLKQGSVFSTHFAVWALTKWPGQNGQNLAWRKKKKPSFPCTFCLMWRPWSVSIIHNFECDFVFTHTHTCTTELCDSGHMYFPPKHWCWITKDRFKKRKKSYTVALTWQRAITLHNFRASFSNLQCMLVHIIDTLLSLFSEQLTITQHNLRVRRMMSVTDERKHQQLPL